MSLREIIAFIYFKLASFNHLSIVAVTEHVSTLTFCVKSVCLWLQPYGKKCLVTDLRQMILMVFYPIIVILVVCQLFIISYVV